MSYDEHWIKRYLGKPQASRSNLVSVQVVHRAPYRGNEQWFIELCINGSPYQSIPVDREISVVEAMLLVATTKKLEGVSL